MVDSEQAHLVKRVEAVNIGGKGHVLAAVAAEDNVAGGRQDEIAKARRD